MANERPENGDFAVFSTFVCYNNIIIESFTYSTNTINEIKYPQTSFNKIY